MISLTVTHNLGSVTARLLQIARDLPAEIEAEMRDEVADIAKRHVEPRIPEGKTKLLKRGFKIRCERRGDRTTLIGSFEAPYARYVEEGTRPHTIKPKERPGQKPGKARLKFPVGGSPVFAREVDHPGTRPVHFIKIGLQEARKDVRAALWGRIRKVLG